MLPRAYFDFPHFFSFLFYSEKIMCHGKLLEGCQLCLPCLKVSEKFQECQTKTLSHFWFSSANERIADDKNPQSSTACSLRETAYYWQNQTHFRQRKLCCFCIKFGRHVKFELINLFRSLHFPQKLCLLQ
jgi:hypothetical protein